MNETRRLEKRAAGEGTGTKPLAAAVLLSVLLIPGSLVTGQPESPPKHEAPPSWMVVPIPRCADYGAPDGFVAPGRVAIVRKEGGPYQTTRDAAAELVGESTVVEEELIRILEGSGVTDVTSRPDDLAAYDGFDTLILLGSPEHNRQTARFVRAMGLSFEKWDDPRTPEDDFTGWRDFGREGYLLKVGRASDKNVVILAGHDRDDAKQAFCGAGTFYALQSLRQLIVPGGDAVRIKTAEIADRPLVAFRGCYTGYPSSQKQNWLDVSIIPLIKANMNVYWYGHNVAGYSAESASKWRYPWKPEQLAFFGRIGKWCRERYVTMVFCLNPDHFNVEWAAPRTLDGKEKDPLHYDPNHPLEPAYREMWAGLGYDVKNDVDVLAAKFAQMNRAVGGGAVLQMMNEDDVYGLVHAEDKKLFKTETGDARQDSINYGRARGELLAALYRRTRELAPDSAEMLPVCPPDGIAYQTALERNDHKSQDFMRSLTATLKKQGVWDKMPILTTGGGTLAETIADEDIDFFRKWCDGGPVLLHENNFALSHLSAYETDPNGPRQPLQKSDQHPAGYRSPELYRRLWAIHWNMGNDIRPTLPNVVMPYEKRPDGLSRVSDVPLLAWCQGQYMWNMLAADREKVGALAVRKVCTPESYPLVKAFVEAFDRPIAYLPDDGPDQMLAVSDGIAFPGKGWDYVISYTDDRRREAQRLRDKLTVLLPQLEAKWDSDFVKPAVLTQPGWDAYNFCCIYLARGYLKGWKEGGTRPADGLRGARLRDLYLEAEEIQQRYFAGPHEAEGRSIIHQHSYAGILNRLHDGRLKPAPASPAKARDYIDIWKEGLLGAFFEPVSKVTVAQIPDGDATLGGAWGKVTEADGETFRVVTGEATIKLKTPAQGRTLVRARFGTEANSFLESTRIRLSFGKAFHEDHICKSRWITWLLPDNERASDLTIKTEKPLRVHAVEIYRTTAK